MKDYERHMISPEGRWVSFEEYLRDYSKEEGKYIKNKGTWKRVHDYIKEEALKRGSDFNRTFLDILKEKGRNDEKALEAYRRLRDKLIRTRQIEVSEEDVEDFLEELNEKNKNEGPIDIMLLARAFNFNKRRIAEALMVLRPDSLGDVESTYLKVHKIITGRVQVGMVPVEHFEDPLEALKEFLRQQERDILLKEEALRRICIEGAKEQYLIKFIDDAEEVLKKLKAEIEAEEHPSIREVLERVYSHYSELHRMKIEGVVEHLIDHNTGERMPFPSIHQKEGIRRILEDKRILIADEMGVGKTAQALLAFIELCNREPDKGHKMLVVCPASVLEHWKKEVKTYLKEEIAEEYEPVVIQSRNKKAALEEAKDAKIVLISYDLIIRSLNGRGSNGVRALEEGSDALNLEPAEAKKIVELLKEIDFSYVVLDEVHRAKNPKYASKAAVVASKYLEKSNGSKKRALIICDEEDVETWGMEINAICNFSGKGEYNILASREPKKTDVRKADIIITSEDNKDKVLEVVDVDLLFDHREFSEYAACQRSAAVHSLVARRKDGGAEYVVLLTGTPLPNRVSDIGNIASILEPENFPNAESFNAHMKKNPVEHASNIRELLIRRMLRRRSSQVLRLPSLSVETIDVELSSTEREIYQRIQDNAFDAKITHKLLWARMATINPGLLVNAIDIEKLRYQLKLSEEQVKMLEELKALAERAPSSKLDKLYGLVKRKVEEGHKVVVFSSVLREGVVEEIAKELTERGVPSTYIHGGVTTGKDGGNRERVRQEFMDAEGPSVLVATLETMGEGVDLTNATVLVMLDYPYTHTSVDQGIARLWRRRQNRPVEVYFLKALNTIDENCEAMIEDKRRVSEFLIDGILTTEQEQKLLEGKSIDAAKGTIVGGLVSPREVVLEYIKAMMGKGGKKNWEYLKGGEWRNARAYADAFMFNWEGSYPANVGRAIAGLIARIESYGDVIEQIVDLGSGPASITRTTGRASVCVDMNPYMLERARKDFGDLVETHNALIDDLPLEDGRFDLAVLSLVLHYAPYVKLDGEEIMERERIMREAARVLKMGGWLILAEPERLVNDEGIELLVEGLEELGFSPNGGFVGFALDANGGQFKTFLLAMRKERECPESLSREDYFILNTEHNIVNIGKSRKKKRKRENKEPSKVEEFIYARDKEGEDVEFKASEKDITKAQNGQVGPPEREGRITYQEVWYMGNMDRLDLRIALTRRNEKGYDVVMAQLADREDERIDKVLCGAFHGNQIGVQLLKCEIEKIRSCQKNDRQRMRYTLETLLRDPEEISKERLEEVREYFCRLKGEERRKEFNMLGLDGRRRKGVEAKLGLKEDEMLTVRIDAKHHVQKHEEELVMV